MVLKSNNNRDLTKGGRFPGAKTGWPSNENPSPAYPLTPNGTYFFLKSVNVYLYTYCYDPIRSSAQKDSCPRPGKKACPLPKKAMVPLSRGGLPVFQPRSPFATASLRGNKERKSLKLSPGPFVFGTCFLVRATRKRI